MGGWGAFPQAIIDTPALWLPAAKETVQGKLDTAFDKQFDLAAFVRGGTLAAITAAQVGTFLAVITNNYRSLRAAIAAAPDIASLESINLGAGWPSNP